ncbi:MAG: tetratricopeptide repeat protein [Proteobacteria bacterium]|nr:tetratricopeptide repeat protein [Pseudomonadota bacterium]
MKRRVFPWLVLCGVFAVFATFFPDRGLADEAKKDIPNTARIILVKAGKLMKDKEYAKAIALLVDFQVQGGRAGEAEGKKGCLHAEVHAALGTCYLLDNKFQQAAHAFDLALQKDPRHLSARLNLAKAAYELRDYPKAAECFTKAYEVAPEKNPEHLYFAAVACLLAKENKRSIALFEKILSAHSDKFRPEWRENLVHALLAAGENLRALPHIKELAETSGDAKQLQWQEILLQQYLQLDMENEALSLVDMLTVRSPTEPLWWRALVHIHLQHNRYQPALAALLVTGYLQPLSEQEMRLIADLYLQLGVPRQAAPVYESILKEKNNPQLLTNLIVALQQSGQTEQALAALEKFAHETISPELSMLKADLLYGLGRYKDAAHFYRKTAYSGVGKQRDRALQMAEYAKFQAGNERNIDYHLPRTAAF